MLFVAVALTLIALLVGALYTVAVTSTLNSQLNATETFSGVGYGTPQTIAQNGLNETVALTGSTTPAVTVSSIGSVALVAGAATLSLEALQGVEGDTVSGAGLKVQHCKFSNPATNANNITIAQGGAATPTASWGRHSRSR